MKISLVIAVYNDYKSLEVVLKSLERQTFREFEIIIAEDCQKKEMLYFLKNNKFDLNIKHVSQEDKGFRKNKILNKAIRRCQGNFIVFIDGDCFLHNKFLETYNEEFEKNTLLVGRRVMLSDNLTKKIQDNFFFPSIIDIFLSKSKHKEEGVRVYKKLSRKNINGLIGSNFGIDKDLLLKINGFDEDYEAPGVGEDDDIYMRLKKIGDVEFKSVRNRAIQYHLEHKRSSLSNNNKKLFIEKEKRVSYICVNGLKKMED